MAGTLQFLINIRDNASQAIGQVRSQFGTLGAAAGQASAALNNLTQAQNQHNASAGALTHTVQRAAAAFLEMAAANAILQGSLEAFRGYEKNMAVVERVTENSSTATADFNSRFLELTKVIGSVPIDRLGVIAGQAAQLGIQGNVNILKFTETMGKLETVLPELGEQAPKLIARLLAITGEGVDNVEKFASMLVRAGKDANSSEQAILHLTSVLSQSTAQFKLGSAALLGMGTAFAEMGLQPELASTAVSRALQALNEASLNNTEGMRELTAVTGLTADEFQKLIRTDPSEAFLKFTDVLAALNKDGRSTLGFLTSLNLQASENIRVLGTVSENVGKVRQSIGMMRAEGAKPTALNQEFQVALKTLDKQIVATSNAWERAKIAFGGALAPLAIIVLKGLRSALDAAADGFAKLPTWAGQVLAWSAVTVPAVLSVVTAIAAVRSAMVILSAAGVTTAFAASFGALFSTIGTILTAIAGFIGSIVAAVASIPVAIIAGVAALIIGGVAIYKYWDDLKAYFEQGFVDGIVNLFSAGIAKMSALWQAFVDWISFKKATPTVDTKTTGTGTTRPQIVVPEPQAVDPSKLSKLTPGNKTQIEQLDQQTKLLDKIKLQEIALDQLRTLPQTDKEYRSPEEMARLQGLVALEKARADAVGWRLKTLGEETQTASAFTQAEKNTLEVITQQRTELEKRGALTQKQLNDIAAATEKLQAARANTALRELGVQLDNSLASSKAVTREQQLQVEIAQKLADLRRTSVPNLTDNQAGIIRNQIEQTKQNENLKATKDRLLPVAAATRDYESEVRVLNEGLRQGALTSAEYTAALAQLNRSTLEVRDPWGAQVKTMRESIGLMRIVGDYQDADRTTQQTINSLRDKGVVTTKAQAAAMMEYNRALADAQSSQNSGFEGWARSVGSFRTGLLDVQREFTANLSTGIVGVLQGDGKNAVANMLKSMGTKALQVSVDQAIKGVGQSTGFFAAIDKQMGTGSGDALDRAAKAATQIETSRSVIAQQVTVTAASVVVNGQTLTGIGADQAKTYIAGGTITPFNKSGPLFTQPGVPSLLNPGPFVGAITAPALSGDSIMKSTSLLKQFEGRISDAKWDVNAYRVGYGSDTITNPQTGQVSRVNAATRGVDQSWADADLARRIPQYQDTIRQQIGYDRFDSLNSDTQAALTSVGYNYGKLPSRIVDTVKTGSYGDIADSVASLRNDNDGVNAKRRLQEAEIIRQSDQQVQQARETAQKVSEVQKQGGQDQVAAVAQAQQTLQSSSATSKASVDQLSQSVEQAGTSAQQAAPKMQQVAANSNQAGIDSQQFSGGLGSLTGSFASAQLGLGQFGGAVSQIFSSIFKSFSGGGGLGSLFSFGAVAHSGWDSVGSSMPGNGYRVINASDFANARRLHSGNNSNEFKAILEKGEKVLTERQADRTADVLKAVGDMGVSGGATTAANTNTTQHVSNSFSMGDTTVTLQGSGNKEQDGETVRNLEKLLDERGDRMMTAWAQNQMRNGGLLAGAGARRR